LYKWTGAHRAEHEGKTIGGQLKDDKEKREKKAQKDQKKREKENAEDKEHD